MKIPVEHITVGGITIPVRMYEQVPLLEPWEIDFADDPDDIEARMQARLDEMADQDYYHSPDFQADLDALVERYGTPWDDPDFEEWYADEEQRYEDRILGY